MFQSNENETFINNFWDQDILPSLMDYIKIPCLSPNFDPAWENSGHIAQALQLAIDWVKPFLKDGDNITVKKIDGLTPVLIIDFAGGLDKSYLIYGHFDKQPEMTGWRDDLGPWKPVIEGDKLYGRGSVDDGYAFFSAVAIVQSIRAQDDKHADIKIVIDFSEESGSCHFPPYLESFPDVFGHPDTIICLDSGAGNYDQLWLTTSLKGMLIADLTVHVLKEGAHSGMASGIVPSSFRILRQLLSRIEDENSGLIKPEAFKIEIPQHRIDEIKSIAEIMESNILNDFPIVDGLLGVHTHSADAILDNTWKTTLSILGQYHIPDANSAGNVLRPASGLKLSFRLPPTLDAEKARKALQKILTENPPYQSKIDLDIKAAKKGWEASQYSENLKSIIDQSSQLYFNKPALYQGLGGSIGFITMLEEAFPKADFIITGAFGPNANIHGPNEFIKIPYAKKITACIAEVVVKA